MANKVRHDVTVASLVSCRSMPTESSEMSRKRASVAFFAGKQQNEVAENRHCAVDAHGDIDLYAEFGWQNVKVIVDKNLKQIQGVNLNCLLKALFILYGFENLNDTTLPGGFHCWEVLLESYLVTITHLCTVDDVIRRIHYLIQIYLNGDGTEGSIDGDCYTVGNLLYGAFTFLMFWVQSFHAYMSDTHVTKLKSGIIGLGQRLKASTEETLHVKSRYSYNYTEVLERFRKRYDELLTVTHNVTQCRLLNTIGLTRQIAASGSNNNKVMTFVHQGYVQPNVRSSTAAWTGFDAQRKKEELKKTIAAAPKVKLEIFGGEALLDASDEDEDEPSSGTGAYGSKGGSKGKSVFFNGEQDDDSVPVEPPPVVRVAPDFSLLQEPYAVSLDLFALDPLELARQWTLADHALFCSIPLHSLLPPPGTVRYGTVRCCVVRTCLLRSASLCGCGSVVVHRRCVSVHCREPSLSMRGDA
jgi:hypothetical protein